MAYTPFYAGGWKDSPDTSTPITAAALTHIEDAVSANADDISAETARAEAAEAALGSSSKPWQFTPEGNGAVGDGKLIGDAAIATGALSTLTSATASFTPADTGKTVMINGALGAATPLITTITYASATTVALTDAATQAVSGANAVYGTDDTNAIRAAYAAAGAYATANDYYAEVIYQPRIYCLAAPPVQQTGPVVNAQIPLPMPPTNTGRKLVIASIGAGSNSHSDYWESTVPNLAGTCLVSMVKAPATVDATYGVQSVIGGPSGGGLAGGFANLKPVLENISIIAGAMCNQYGADFGFCGGARLSQCSAKAFAAVADHVLALTSLPGSTFFQSRSSAGFRLPVTGNNADVTADVLAVEGFVTAVIAADTFTASKVEATYCCFGLMVDGTLGLSSQLSPIVVDLLAVGESLAAIHVSGAGSVPVYIHLATEGIVTAHIQDSGNALRGEIRWTDTGASTPVLTGATGVHFTNDNVAAA